MLSLGGSHRVYLSTAAVDFRKAHDGLCAIIRDRFHDDPFTGDVFVFHNAARDRVKLLVWERNGFWLLYKRLERGPFPPVRVAGGERVELTRAQLAMLVEGFEWSSAKQTLHHHARVDISKRDGTRTRTPA